MNKVLAALTVLCLSVLAACQPASTPNDNGSAPVFDNLTNQTINASDNTTNGPSDLNGTVEYEITATEGDAIRIPLRATDPDGDELSYSYEEPFNSDGVWQTEQGDAGSYVIGVNASDGQSTTRTSVLVTVERANRAPNLDCPDTFTFKEGELAALNCDVYDPEGDRVIVSYSGWTTSRTKRTDYGDAGNYSALVRARDTNNNSVEEEVNVVIQDVNRAPTIQPIDDQTVEETTTFSIDPNVSDPDGDDVSVNYTQPLNSQGVWETRYGDAGEYEVTVVASDGDKTAKETFTLSVTDRNQAPVIRPLDNITVEEGETVTIRPETYDPDGDDVSLTYDGWMTSNKYTTTFEDAYPDGCNEKGCTASYTVFVEATDGDLTTQESLTVFVEDKNRPPQFTTE